MSLWINSEQGGSVTTQMAFVTRPNRADSTHEQDFAAANVDIKKVFNEDEYLPKQKQGSYFVSNAKIRSMVTKLADC